MAKKTELKKRQDVAKKKLRKDFFIGAEDVQEVTLRNEEEAHLYGEVIMQFHVKADAFHPKDSVSGIEVSKPLDGNGKPWRPVVCRWYVEKGPVEVKGKEADGVNAGGTVEWKPYNPRSI